MIRTPQELTESIRQAVDRRAVVFSHITLAVLVAVHTALDPLSYTYQIVLAFILSGVLTVLILLRFFDLGTVNKHPLTYIIVYQLFCFFGLAFISDSATPYTIGVYLVVFVSNLYYGARGVWATVVCFGITSIAKYVYLVATLNINLTERLNIIVGFFLFAAVCSVFVNIQKVYDWDRARLKETEIKLTNSINSLELGFIITDGRPEISISNNAAHALLCGSTKHTAKNCPTINLDHLLKEFDSPELANAIEYALKTGSQNNIKALDYKKRVWSVFVSPMKDAETITGLAIVMQDVTEEQLLSRTRDEFFSIASHELRTPLTTIRGNSSMMLDYYPEAFKDPALKQMLQDIHDSSKRLIAIVNDFLDVSHLEQGRVKYRLEPLALKSVLQSVCNEIKESTEKTHNKIVFGNGLKDDAKLPDILADKDRLTQILYNLLGNSLKFTENGTITISASLHEGDMMRVDVTDTGKGIEPKMQPLLFRKFQQAGKSLLAREGEGTGLGLYVSRLMAEGMGGSLDLVHSEPLKGSTFSFTIPTATTERIAAATKAFEESEINDEAAADPSTSVVA